MKRVHPIFIFFFLILAGAIWEISSLWLNQRTIINFPPSGTHIVALGNSLTLGIGASSPEKSFIPQLEKRTKVSIVNKGVAGDTTKDGLARLERDVLSEKPDIVIVELGGNDYLRHIPEAEIFSNLRSIISQIQLNGAVVILLGVRGGVLVDHFDDNFESLSKETGTLYVPNILDGIIGHTSLMSDEIHPNDKGYEKIVDKVAPTLLGVINAAPIVLTE